jgi:hypothetical protein
MKVVLYKRYQASGIHIHYFSSAHCVFAPELEAVLFAEASGSFQSYELGLNDGTKDGGRVLEEARVIYATGKPPAVESGPEITDIKFAEFDGDMLKQLASDLRAIRMIRDRTTESMKKVLGERVTL